MDAPKCRLCGQHHYGLCRFASTRQAYLDAGYPLRDTPQTTTPTAQQRPAEPIKPAAPRVINAKIVNNGTADVNAGLVDPRAGHNAYMRAYMREWRAKRKAAKTAATAPDQAGPA
jgi:hypothetical protein